MSEYTVNRPHTGCQIEFWSPVYVWLRFVVLLVVCFVILRHMAGAVRSVFDAFTHSWANAFLADNDAVPCRLTVSPKG